MMKQCTVAVAAILIAGCGLEDYESRMADRLAVLQEQTRYESLWGPTTIDAVVGDEVIEYPITVRLPRLFGDRDWYREGSEYGYRQDVVENIVLYPPFLLEFPGFNRVGEAFAEPDERSTIAYYCYLGVLESREAKMGAVLADLRQKTAEKLPDVSSWQDVECRDENLTSTTWKMMEAKGKQKFPDRSGDFRDSDGTFRVYAREDQGYIVLWAVRAPNSISDIVPLLDLADAVAGTVKITDAAPTEPFELPPASADAKDATLPDDAAPDAAPPET